MSFPLPVAEATGSGLKCFVGVSVKVSSLEGPTCWSSTTMKEVSCPLGALLFGCHLALLRRLVDDLASWHLSLWNSEDVFSTSWCWLLMEGLWHICGSCNGAPRMCRLLGWL